MLSTRFGYRRPARFALVLAARFFAGDNALDLDFGFRFFHGGFFAVVLAIDNLRRGVSLFVTALPSGNTKQRLYDPQKHVIPAFPDSRRVTMAY